MYGYIKVMVCEKLAKFKYSYSQYITMKKIRFGISIDEEAVKTLDDAVAKKGRFANRSQAIEYCIKQVLAMEEHKRGSMEFLLDFMDLVEKHPEIKERFAEFLKGEME